MKADTTLKVYSRKYVGSINHIAQEKKSLPIILRRSHTPQSCTALIVFWLAGDTLRHRGRRVVSSPLLMVHGAPERSFRCRS